jgi:hypothetical protein
LDRDFGNEANGTFVCGIQGKDLSVDVNGTIGWFYHVNYGRSDQGMASDDYNWSKRAVAISVMNKLNSAMRIPLQIMPYLHLVSSWTSWRVLLVSS